MRAPLSRLLLTAALAACALVGCGHTQPTPPKPSGATARAGEPSPRFVSPYSYEWFIRAEILAARGDLKAAISAYRAALASADEDPYVLARLADVLDQNGQRAAAEAALDDAAARDPRSEAAWLVRGDIAQRHAELDRALAAYERAEACAPISSRAPLALARLLRTAGHVERAIAVLTRYEARTLPGSVGAARAALDLALTRHDPSALERAARDVITSRAEAREPLLATARSLLEQGHAVAAARVLSAFHARPDEAVLRMRVALAAGEYASAEAWLAGIRPEALGGLAATAEAFLAVHRAELALDLANAALNSAPTDSRARRVHARAALQLGRYTEAAESYATLVREAASNDEAAEARAGLARTLRAQGLEALASALR